MKKVLIAILARDKEATLPLYLKCIKNLDYDKKSIVLYIRTNDNSDDTEQILTDFIIESVDSYSHIEYNNSNIRSDLKRHHDWDEDRFKVLGNIRNESLQKTIQYGCDYYFVVDCDNFLVPSALKLLLRFDVPIVCPMMHSDNGTMYSNYHYHVNEWGYFKDDIMYHHIWHRNVKGLFQVAVVHCTYLIKAEVIPNLSYTDDTTRHEYVIFSDSARKNNIPQYIDNTDPYGVITFNTQKEEMNNFEINYFIPLLPKDSKEREGINIHGFARGDFGIAEHCRGVVNSISHIGTKFCVKDSDNYHGHTFSNNSISKHITNTNPFKVNIFCQNADHVTYDIVHSPNKMANQYNISYGFWELSEFPDVYSEQNKYVNEIWAPSKFIFDAVSQKTTLPVIHMPIAVDFEVPTTIDRKYFNLPEDKFIFLFTFDMASWLERKNPTSAIKAFTQAFPTNKNEDVCLVIKINRKDWHTFYVNKLREEIVHDPRIIIIDEIYDRNTILNLINTCNAYVSLHRSEGFGLGLAEAMKMGKVAIATNYSGNLDFMNEDNSCLVDYKLIKVLPDQYVHVGENSVWADTDIDHAAYYMRKVFEDREFCKRIGQAGKDYIDKHHNFTVIGENYKRRLKQLNLI